MPAEGQHATPSAPQDYADIFRQRGEAHAEAFRRYPEVCREEGNAILHLAAPKTGETLLDLPAASGYLSAYLDVPGVSVIAVDPNPLFHAQCLNRGLKSHLAALDTLPLPDASVDVAVCLAGLHHEVRRRAVFEEIRRVIGPKGRLAIAEIAVGTPVAAFFDGFVNDHNSMGHQGMFVDQTFIDDLTGAGFRIDRDEMAYYHWNFASPAILAEFLQLGFGIDQASPAEILWAVETVLGTDPLPGGGVAMRWCLRTFLACPSIQPG